MPRHRRKKQKEGTKMKSCLIPEGDPNIELSFSDSMGRYVVARKDLQAGVLVLRESPLVVGPCQDSPPCCLGCYTPIKDFSLRCKCGWPECGAECPGRGSQLGHSDAECELLAATTAPASPKDFLLYNPITPLRCLSLREQDPEKWERVEEMESHDVTRRGIEQIWTKNQRTVVDTIRGDWDQQQYPEELIHTVCGYLEVNCFAVGAGGRALYPTAFLLSHDCEPNMSHLDGADYVMSLRTAVPVPTGQPLTISYASTLHGTGRRRQALLESKFFECECRRCRDPTELGTMMSALLCACKGPVLPLQPLSHHSEWRCRLCHSLLPTEQALSLTHRSFEEVEGVKDGGVEEYEAVLTRYHKTLHAGHYVMVAAMYSLSQLYGKAPGYLIHQLGPEQLARKETICRQLMRTFDVLEPGLSRIRGVTLYELHAAIMLVTQSSVMRQQEVRARLREVVGCLEGAVAALRHEDPASPEGETYRAAVSALQQTKKWSAVLR